LPAIGLAPDEDCSVITRPNTVSWPAVKTHSCFQRPVRLAIERNSGMLQNLPGSLFFCFVLNQEFYSLISRKVANDLSEYPGDWMKLSGPIGAMMWPCEPGCGMGFPLRGHTVVKLGGGLSGSRLSCA
jgi:hypothetical protein